MQTLTIELTGNNSLKPLRDFEYKNLISIVKGLDLNSFAFHGGAINEEDFKKWVEHAEGTPTVSLTEAKQRWAAQKKKTQEIIR